MGASGSAARRFLLPPPLSRPHARRRQQSPHSGGSPETGCGEGDVACPASLHRLRGWGCPEGAPLSQLVPVKAGDGTGKQPFIKL